MIRATGHHFLCTCLRHGYVGSVRITCQCKRASLNSLSYVVDLFEHLPNAWRERKFPSAAYHLGRTGPGGDFVY